MKNLTRTKAVRTFFPQVLVHLFKIFKKVAGETSSRYLMITLKNLTVGFFLQVLQKGIAISAPQNPHLFFFCSSNCLFRVSIYLSPFE